MEQNALYYKIPYVKEFDTEVLTCRSVDDPEIRKSVFGQDGAEWPLYAVYLRDHGFYPEGGGQASDTGSLQGITEELSCRVCSVQEVKAEADTIVHYTDAALPEGLRVHAVIDWEKRMRNSRNHSGEHIVSGLVHRHYGYHNVGFHMSDVMTIDFDGSLSMEQLLAIEKEANDVVLANHPVKVFFPEPSELESIDYRSKKALSGTVRLVDLGGADLCACCGTHVMTTGEIGPIKILSVMGHKGGVRVEMFCGTDALADYQRKHQQLLELSHLLSASPEEILSAVKNVMNISAAKDQRIAELNDRYFMSLVEQYRCCDQVLILYENDLNTVELRKCCDRLMKHTAAPVVLMLARKPGSDAEYNYVAGSLSEDLRALSKEFNARVHGRGGGQKEMIQGSLRADPEEVRLAAEQLFGPVYE